MIKAEFKSYGSYTTDSVSQWDLNQKLTISGLDIDVAPVLAFSCFGMYESIIVQSKLSDGVITCDVPNAILQFGKNLNVDLCSETGGQYKAFEKMIIPVNRRKKPSDYLFTDNVPLSTTESIKADLEEEINSNKTYMDKVKTELKNDNKTLNGRIDTILTGTANTTKLVTVHSATIRNNSASDLTFKISSKDNETLKSIKDKSPTVINANVIAKALDGVAINGKGIPSSYNVESTNDEYVITVYSGSSSVVGQYVFMAVVTIAYEDIATDISSAELKDVRAGADGTVYKSAGEAVRQQIGSLKESSCDNHNLIQVAINEFDGYRSLSDQVIEDGGMHCAVSDFIPCVPKQKFRYKGFANANVYSVCFFDSNKEIIGHEQYDSKYTYTEVEIPNNCYFVKFQSFGYKSSSSIAELDFKLTDSTDLKNMLSFPQMEENKKNIVKLEEKIGNSILKYKDLTSELLTLDVYINKQGNAVNADKGTALGSEYIKVEKGDMFRLTGYANYAVAGICQYDSNMRFLKAQLYSEDNTGYIYTNHEIEIDENTAYIRLCAYGISSHEYKIEKKCIVSLYDFINDYIDTDNEYDGNILKGKKWTACGDSFTEGDFTGFIDENGLSGKNSPVIYDGNRGMYKTYPWWIAERNNMELVNEAKCGSKFTNVDNATSGNVFSLRYKNVPLDSDYITFMFGLNEVGLTDAQIGTESDSDITTLWGAYNVIFEYFLTNAPKAKMMVIIPDAWMNKKYADATKAICDHWGIVCRDLKFDTSVTMGIGGRSNVSSKATELRDKAFKVTDKNSHPNVVAHEYRSTVIESWMRAL